MKRRLFHIAAAVTAAAMMLTACTAGKEPDRGIYEGDENNGKPTEAPDKPTDPDPTEAPVSPSDKSVTVSSVKELVEAIRPDVFIYVEPGTYSISDYLAAAWAAEGEDWNSNHDYVEIRQVYDGFELVIKNVENLTIEGKALDRASTHFQTDPRYAAVMAFEDCTFVNLSAFTMGHTDTGNCYGSVIDFRSCEAIALGNVDLYGCGVIGLNLENCTNYLFCNNVILRDCLYGPLSNDGSSGVWQFDDCTMTGSTGSCLYDTDGLEICFNNCVFGDRETENFLFIDNVTANDCEWGEVQNYPDYSAPGFNGDYIPETFTTEGLSVSAFDKTMLTYPYWAGFEVIDDVTGETRQKDVWVYFYGDGTGMLWDGNDETGFDWYMDSQYGAALTFEDGSEAGAIIYVDKNAKDSTTWLQLYMDGHGSWFAPLYPIDTEE